MAIDNNLINDEEIGLFDHRLELYPNGTHDPDMIYPVYRRDFPSAFSPVAFPIVLRHLSCQSCMLANIQLCLELVFKQICCLFLLDAWEVQWFQGVGFPSEDRARRSNASILYYGAGV